MLAVSVGTPVSVAATMTGSTWPTRHCCWIDEYADQELALARSAAHADPVASTGSASSIPDPAAHQLLVDSGELDSEVAALEPVDTELADRPDDGESAGDRPGTVTLP